MAWRAAWARSWDDVRWCSDRCRAAARGDRGEAARLEAALVALLAARAGDASVCPSEVARAVGGEAWRSLMEPVRAAARRLVARGEVEVCQGGRVVDPSTARGPIRVRRTRR